MVSQPTVTAEVAVPQKVEARQRYCGRFGGADPVLLSRRVLWFVARFDTPRLWWPSASSCAVHGSTMAEREGAAHRPAAYDYSSKGRPVDP